MRADVSPKQRLRGRTRQSGANFTIYFPAMGAPRPTPNGQVSSGQRYPLGYPLARLTKHDTLTLQDAFEGIHIFGGLGSGKTSGSGQTLAHAFLRSGFGGLVLTAKPGETELWKRYGQQTGRAIILIGPDHPHRFNFIEYEMGRPGRGAGIASNLVSLFEEVLEVHTPGKVLGGDPYWREARGQLLRNAIDLVRLGTDRLDFEDVVAVIRTAPRRPEERDDPKWRQESRCWRLMQSALDRVEASGIQTDQHDLKVIADYFFGEFAPLDPEPRSSIVSMVGALTDMMVRGEIRKLFLTTTNIVPDVTENGAVIVFDMPVQEYREAGRFAQVLFKTIFQRMVERRQNRSETARPLFLWADESQLFSTHYDTTFQTTARESRVATVYLTQNLPNYYDAFGSDSGGRDRTKKLLGAFGIKIFHANGDLETNKFAEQLFGQELTWRESESSGYSDSTGTNYSSQSKSGSSGRHQAIDFAIRAKRFTEMLRGGPQRGWTEAYAFRAGEPWKTTNSNLLYCRFPQTVQHFPRNGRSGGGRG